MSVQKTPGRPGGIDHGAIHWEEDLRPLSRLPRQPRRAPQQQAPAWIPALVSLLLVSVACLVVATFINNNRPALNTLALAPTATLIIVTPTATELVPPTATPYTPPTDTPPPPTPTAPAVSDDPIFVGAQVKVVDTGPNGLNFRREPSRSAERIRSLPEGSVYEVIGGPVEAEGYTWWQLRDPSDGTAGWGAGIYLRKVVQP
ncbi:MAG: SH3 domain-containing protein [Anaerolineae bacterium]|nr:SH3 domain-containing protein [Thermoflexales bacterium]MDW8407130.1 SH3 domain-containing protein [Anaerolineae bacterium]